MEYRRGIHEIKVEEVLDAEGLEEEHHIPQVRPLDLRDSVVQHFKVVGDFGEEAPADARARAPCAPCALPSVCLTLWRHLQRDSRRSSRVNS